MRYLDFDVDENFREITVHGDDGFPMAVYLQQFKLNQRGCVILHWHDEMQISLVTKGNVFFSVNGKEYIVQEGEGLFIRSKCLHSAKPEQDEAEYVCIDFHPALICGIPNGRIQTHHVDPYMNRDCIEAIHFNGLETWHADALKKISHIIDVEQKHEYGCELEMQIGVCSIWLDIIRNMHGSCNEEQSIPSTDRQRMKAFIQYIHDHHTAKILLLDIAQAANISTGECCRIFKRNLHISPMEYLINYRVAQSARLLIDTDKSISEIAQISGFGSSSYYTERFKKLIKCTPKEYRRNYAIYYVNDQKKKESERHE